MILPLTAESCTVWRYNFLRHHNGIWTGVHCWIVWLIKAKYIFVIIIGHRRWRRGAMAPHFCWTMLARKDRDTLIEQSSTLIEQSTAISLKTAGNYSSNIVKKCLNTLSKLLKCEFFSWGQAPDPHKYHLCYNFHCSLSIVNVAPPLFGLLHHPCHSATARIVRQLYKIANMDQVGPIR